MDASSGKTLTVYGAMQSHPRMRKFRRNTRATSLCRIRWSLPVRSREALLARSNAVVSAHDHTGTGEEREHTLLHFGAVDFQTTVYLNGREIGTHTGGYQSFTFDITEAAKPGENELVVKVNDPTDGTVNPHGKQTLHPQGIMYTASSGVWQTVWLKSVPTTYIEGLDIKPDVNRTPCASGHTSTAIKSDYLSKQPPSERH